jgi:hypothetical protein
MTSGILEQIHTARRNPMAAMIGLLLGGGVPLAIYFYAHELTTWRDPRALIVVGGLLFSAKTVWQWGRLAFDCPYKATGYVLRMEGVMITSAQPLLSRLALAFLVGINAIATACTIARENPVEQPATPSPSLTVAAVARERNLPRRAAAKVVDEQLAAGRVKPRPA